MLGCFHSLSTFPWAREWECFLGQHLDTSSAFLGIGNCFPKQLHQFTPPLTMYNSSCLITPLPELGHQDEKRKVTSHCFTSHFPGYCQSWVFSLKLLLDQCESLSTLWVSWLPFHTCHLFVSLFYFMNNVFQFTCLFIFLLCLIFCLTNPLDF